MGVRSPRQVTCRGVWELSHADRTSKRGVTCLEPLVPGAVLSGSGGPVVGDNLPHVGVGETVLFTDAIETPTQKIH